jgi:hypothetical protein
MKTYKDLLIKLLSLDETQLNSDLFVLCEGRKLDIKISIVINEDSLYEFKDTYGNMYLDFEEDKISQDIDCRKVLPENYPIIYILT